MELTILGKYGPWPAQGGACSGYYVRAGKTRLLLDCGSGVLSRLQQYASVLSLSAVVLSHLHADHMADMLILRYALQLQSKDARLPLKLFMPDEPRREYEMISGTGLYDVTAPQGEHTIDDCKLRFCAMEHPIPSYAVRIEWEGRTLVYSGDTRYTPALVEFARDADVLLCDAGHLERDRVDNLPHLTAHQAAQIARDAGVKQLICSHIDPLTEQSALREEACAVFENSIVAREAETLAI